MSEWEPPVPPPDEVHNITVALKGAFLAAGESTADDLGLDFDFLLPDAAEYAVARGAELIGMRWQDGMLIPNPRAEWAISDTTRDEANKLLSEALRAGDSYQTFSTRLEDSGLFDDARADLVARNEIALAMSNGKVASFKNGDVEMVYIYDEDGCGEEVCDVDGQLWSVEEYEAEPLGHPNCTRDARPATQSELAEEGFGEEDAEEAA